ncbi:MAG: D-alanyl-D-alanine carboxypeptidase [Solirubrobacterales bacterium]|nr:D-alanyl-D-alanine carboxypeptidase [Solirubrobacterales bacterium]
MTRAPVAVLAAVACAAAGSPALAAPPAITARTAFLFQPDTRDVVYARGAQTRRPIASTTKLMTALVSLDKLDLRKTYTLPPYLATAGESLAGLRGGERMTFADLLRAMMLPSANDAASDVAILSSGSVAAFVREMNARARELGLRNTHFSTPIGLDQPGNYSSAEDLVKMALLLRRNSFVREIMDQPEATLHSGARERVVDNRNDLVGRYPFVDGVKTGHTIDAGYVLVGSATSNGVSMVSSVLGAPSMAARDADSLALLRYGLDRYERQTAVRAHQVLRRVPVDEQGDARAELTAERSLSAVVRKGERLRVRVSAAPGSVEGPLAAGAKVGTVEVLRRGAVVARTNLVIGRDVPKATVPQRVRSWLGRPGTIVLLAFLAGCTVLLLLLRRRVVRRRGSGEREAS